MWLSDPPTEPYSMKIYLDIIYSSLSQSCLLVGFRLMFIAPLAKSEIIQFCWRFDSMMSSSFWHDDFNVLFFFISFFHSFIHSSFLLWETKIHFLLIGQWGAFESIMFKIGIEKRHHFSFFSFYCQMVDIGLPELCSERLCSTLIPNIESMAFSDSWYITLFIDSLQKISFKCQECKQYK